MGKRKNNDRLHPPTGDPFDKAEGAMDKLKMGGGMGDNSGYDNPFKAKNNKGFGSFSGDDKGMGFGDMKGMGFGDFNKLGNEKQIRKNVKKGKKKFDKEKKPFDMFGGLQGDDGKGFGYGNDNGKGFGY